MLGLDHAGTLTSVNINFGRPFLLVLGISLGSSLWADDDSTAAGTPPPTPHTPEPATPLSPEPAIELPTIQVTKTRVHEIDVTITKLDKLIAREKKKVKSSELDKALNNPKLAQTAAIFGGNSAAHLSAVAASRVSLLETERAVLEAMKRPSTLQGLAMLEAELEQLRTTRRNLDNATR